MAEDKNQKGQALNKPAGKRAPGSELSEEERALWEHAARDLKPLKSAKGRVPDTLAQDTGPTPPRADKPKQAQRGRATDVPRPASLSKPSKKTADAPPLRAELDRRKTRRIEVDARIDLHGMRQSEAHAALRRFLIEAHANRLRWVLVITGKGTTLRRSMGAEEDSGYGGEERGVLRRNVPRWLAEPDLRTIVVGFASAAIRHGGEGALYVQLRRRDRSGRSG